MRLQTPDHRIPTKALCGLPGLATTANMQRLSLSIIVSLLLTLTLGLAAAERRLGLAVLPPQLSKDVRAFIQLNQPRWVVESVATMATALGLTDGHTQAYVAEFLFGSVDLSGIDLSRPAVLAWRTGDAPLVGMIPVADRSAFLRTFGLVQHIDRLLMRVGERDGTVVYSQNTDAGLFEYRMMFRDGYAYLARNSNECRLLADFKRSTSAFDGAPLIMRASGESIADMAMRHQIFSSMPAGFNIIQELPWLQTLQADVPAFMKQADNLTLTIESKSEGRVKIQTQISAVTDTDLAAWSARQVNTGSRYLPVLARSDDIARFHANIRWKGEMEAIGRNVIQEILETNPAILPAEREHEFRSYFRMFDNREQTAGAWGLRLNNLTANGSEIEVAVQFRGFAQQIHAAEFLNILRSVDLIFGPETAVGDFGALAGLMSYRGQHRSGTLQQIMVADRNKIVSIYDPVAAQAQAATQEVIGKLQEVRAPIGEVGIAVLRLEIGNIANHLASITKRKIESSEPLAVDIVLKADGQGGLVIESEFPLQKLGLQLGRAGFGILSEYSFKPAPLIP